MKKFLVVIVAVVLIFLFVSCAPAQAPTESQPGATTSTPNAVQTSGAAETNHDHNEMTAAAQGAADPC